MAMNNLTSTAYADHLRGCADLAKEIAVRMDIRDDSARQAMLATLIISADRHNLFLEPTPPHAKTPVGQNGADAAAKDEAAAQKADEQIKDVPRNTTAAQAEAGKTQALLKGITQAMDLLNKEGHVPPITTGGLNTFIKKEFQGKANLSFLDGDELEKLTKLLSEKLDGLRERKAIATDGTTAADDLGW